MRSLIAFAVVLSLIGCATSSSDDVGSSEGASKVACSPTLVARELGSLATTKDQFEAGCANDNVPCRMTNIRAFDLGDCGTTVTIDDITARVQELTAFEDQDMSWSVSPALDATAVAGKTYFETHGPSLLSDIAAWAGSSEVIGRELAAELSCPNCHDFKVRYILFYPVKRTVVVLDGRYGYDS
jgi:hypothetical protein